MTKQQQTFYKKHTRSQIIEEILQEQQLMDYEGIDYIAIDPAKMLANAMDSATNENRLVTFKEVKALAKENLVAYYFYLLDIVNLNQPQPTFDEDLTAIIDTPVPSKHLGYKTLSDVSAMLINTSLDNYRESTNFGTNVIRDTVDRLEAIKERSFVVSMENMTNRIAAETKASFDKLRMEFVS